MYFSNISNKNNLLSRSSLSSFSMTSELDKKFSFDIYNSKSSYDINDALNNNTERTNYVKNFIKESSVQSSLTDNTNTYSVPPSKKLLSSSSFLPLENRPPYLGGISSDLYSVLVPSDISNIDTSAITFRESKPHPSSINISTRSSVDGINIIAPSRTPIDPISFNQAFRDSIKPQTGYIDNITKDINQRYRDDIKPFDNSLSKGFNEHYKDLMRPKYEGLEIESNQVYRDSLKAQSSYVDELTRNLNIQYRDNIKSNITGPSLLNSVDSNNLVGAGDYNEFYFKSKKKTTVSQFAKKVEISQAGLDNYHRVIQLVFDFENRSLEGARLPELGYMREKRYADTGAGALYDPRKNLVAVDDSIINQLNKGKLSKESFGTLAHKIAHSYQSNFGNTWKKQRMFENRRYSSDIDEIKPGNLIEDKYTKRVVKASFESRSLFKKNMRTDLPKERIESEITRNARAELDAYSLEDRITRSVDIDRIFDPDYKLTKVGYRTEDTIRKVRAKRDFNKKLALGTLGTSAVVGLGVLAYSFMRSKDDENTDEANKDKLILGGLLGSSLMMGSIRHTSFGEYKTLGDLEGSSKAQRNLEKVAKKVFDYVGVDFDLTKTPTIGSYGPNLPEGFGGTYVPSYNELSMNPQMYGELQKGKISKNTYSMLAHELIHAYQFNVGGDIQRRLFSDEDVKYVSHSLIDWSKKSASVQPKNTPQYWEAFRKEVEAYDVQFQLLEGSKTYHSPKSRHELSLSKSLPTSSTPKPSNLTSSVQAGFFDPSSGNRPSFRGRDFFIESGIRLGTVAAIGLAAATFYHFAFGEGREGRPPRPLIGIDYGRPIKDSDINPEDFKGRTPYVGIDLSRQEREIPENAPQLPEDVELEQSLIIAPFKEDSPTPSSTTPLQSRSSQNYQQRIGDLNEQVEGLNTRTQSLSRQVDTLKEQIDPQTLSAPQSGSQQYQPRIEALRRGELYTSPNLSETGSTWRSQPITNRSREEWENLLKEEVSVATRLRGPGDELNILLGDSITQWFRPSQLPVGEQEGALWLNQGISDQNIEQIEDRLDTLKSVKGDRVFIMAGINDLRQGRSDKEILENYSSMLDRVKNNEVADEVVVQSILPTRLENLSTNRIKSLNSQIKAMAEERGMRYVDLLPHFLNDEGQLKKEYTTDGIHLSRKGYETWSKLMSQHLNQSGDVQDVEITATGERLQRNESKAGESIIPPSSSVARQAAKNNKDKDDRNSSSGGGGDKPPGTPRPSSPDEEPENPRDKAGIYSSMDSDEKKTWIDRLKSTAQFITDEKHEDIIKGVVATAGVVSTFVGAGFILSKMPSIAARISGISSTSAHQSPSPFPRSSPPPRTSPSSSTATNLSSSSVGSTVRRSSLNPLIATGIVSTIGIGVVATIAAYSLFTPGEDRTNKTSVEKRSEYYSSPQKDINRTVTGGNEDIPQSRRDHTTIRGITPEIEDIRETSQIVSKTARRGSIESPPLRLEEYLSTGLDRRERPITREVTKPSVLSLEEYLSSQSEVIRESNRLDRNGVSRDDIRSSTLSLSEYLSRDTPTYDIEGMGTDNISRTRYLAIIRSRSRERDESDKSYTDKFDLEAQIVTRKREVDSQYGVSSMGTLRRFLSTSDQGSVRGTQFVLEPRYFNSSSGGERFGFLNPVLSKFLTSESSLLSRYEAEIVLDTTVRKADKEAALAFARRHHSGIMIREYEGKQTSLFKGGYSSGRLLHSKIFIGEKDSDSVAMLDTAMYGNFSIFDIHVGLKKRHKDFFYVTNDPDTVRGLEAYYEDLKEGETTDKRYSDTVITGTEILRSLMQDIESSDSQVLIYSATIEGHRKRSFSREDYIQKDVTNTLVDLLAYRGEKGLPTFVSSKDFESNIYQKLHSSGVAVSEVSKDKKIHYNLFYVEDINDTEEDILYLSTRRISSSANEEIAIRLSSFVDPEAVKYFLDTAKEDINFEEAVKSLAISKRVGELGVSGLFAGLYRGSDKAGTLLLDPNMGASYFYGRALYNNQQRQARAHFRVIDQETSGVATAMYKAAYLAKLNEDELTPQYSDLDRIPGIVQQYDRELYTPGIGAILNEKVFMRLGLGRLYKDELGFLPSVMGALGSVIDKTYLYLNPNANVPGITHYFKDLDIKDSSYTDRPGPTGIFEAGLSELAFLTQASAQGVLFYMIVGEPVSMFLSETLKNDVERIVSTGLSSNFEEFNSRTAWLHRKANLSLGDYYKSPISARMQIMDTLDNLRGINSEYFGAENPGLSLYHFSSIYLRGRSGILLNEVMKPFLMEIVNPYDPNDVNSNWGFSNVIDRFIEEVRRPVGLRAITPSDPHIKDIKLSRVNVHTSLYNKGISKNLVQGMKVDEIIGYKYAREEFVNKARDFLDTSTFQTDVVRNRIDSFKSYLDRFGNFQDFTAEELGNLFVQLDILESGASPEQLEDVQKIRRGLMNVGRSIDDPSTRLASGKALEMTREGRLISDIEFEVVNEGIDRSSAIARRLQDLLDEIPLNPLNWRIFNKYRAIRGITGQDLEKQGYERITTTGRQESGRVIPRVRTIGEFFSFSDLNETMREILFGRGGFSQHLARTEVFSDKSRWRRLSNTNFDNLTYKQSVQVGLDLFGYSAKASVDKIHSLWNAMFGFAYESSKRVIDKYVYLKGSLLAPFGIGTEKGLLRGAHALKDMEYYLLNMQDSTTGLKAISWGDDLDEVKTAIRALEKEAIDEFRSLSNTERIAKYGAINEAEYIDRYVSDNLTKATRTIDPTARRLNWLDENVVQKLAEAEDVRNRFMTNPSRPFDYVEIQERLRAETIGLFRMGTVNDEILKNRMVRMSPGLGRDVTGKITKSTLTTTALSISVLSSLILSDLFQSTSGVSLFTQLGFSLFSGGGPIGRLLGNEQGELGINTEFGGDRLLPDLPGLGRVGTTLLTTAATLYTSHIIGVSALRAEAINYSFTTDFMFNQLKNEEGVDIILSAAKGSNEADISLRQKILNGEIKKGRELSEFIDLNATRNISMKVKYKDSFETTLSLFKNADMLNIRSMRFRGNAWLNTMIAYAGISIGGKALVSSTSTILNSLREANGSLDPLAFGVAGALIGSKMTKSFGGGLAGLLIGGLGSFAMNRMGVKVFNLGDPGTVVDNQGATLLGELSDFRSSVIANFDKASRIELMAALVSQGIESPYSLGKQQGQTTGVKVVAKQVTSPIVQFFMAKKTQGQYTDYTGKVVDPGVTTYSLGIQGPPITGMSLGVQLPFKILKDIPSNNSSGFMNRGSRRFNLVYNDEVDILDYMYGLGMIATSAQILSYSLRTIGALGAPFTPAAYDTLGRFRSTHDNLFTEAGKTIGRFGKAVEDIGLAFPNLIHRTGQYLFESDLMLGMAASRKRILKNSGNVSPTSVSSFNRSRNILRYGSRAAFGAFVFNFGVGLLQDDDTDFTSNSLMLSMTGAGVGTTSLFLQDAMSPTIARTLNNPVIGKSLTHINKFRKGLLPYALSALVGYHLTDDRFGVFTGMSNEYVKREKHDEYFSYHREAVIASYTVAMGTIGAVFGGMGMDSATTLEKYSRALTSLNELENIQQSNTAGDGILRRVKRAYQAHRVQELENEAQHIVDYFRHRGKQIQENFELVAEASPGIAEDSLREFHLNKARQVIEDTGAMSARQIMSMHDEADTLIYHVNKSRGAHIDGRLSSRRFSRRLMKGMIGVPIATYIVGSLLHSVNPNVFNANNFYDWIEGRNIHYQPGDTFMKARNVLADTIRAITFTDRTIDSGISLDQTFRSAAASGGFYRPVSHEKLLIRQSGYGRSLTKLFRDLSEIAILDDVNPFLSGPLGAGASIRPGERGTVLTPYVQIQTSGSDISTASYSMSSRFFFRNVLQGNNDLIFEVQNAMRMRNEMIKKGLDPSVVMRRTALNIVMATSSLQPRKRPRRASRLSDSQLSSISSDPLLVASLKERMAIQRHTNYQPVESIVTQMLIEQMMPTHKYLDNMLMNVLSPEGAKKLGIGKGKNLASYMMGDPYYLLSRKINMLGIKFFGDQPGGVRGRNVSISTREFPDLFGEYSSQHLETYAVEGAQPSPFVEGVSDNFNRLFGTLPTPVNVMLALSLGITVTSRALDFVNFAKGSKEVSESQKMLKELSSERWFTGTTESDVVKSAWLARNFPQIGSSQPLTAGGTTIPIISKGTFHFMLNPSSFGVQQVTESLHKSLAEVQQQLDDARLNFRGQSINMFEYMQINQIRELENIIGGTPNQTQVQNMTVYDNSGNRVFGVDTNKAWLDNLSDARDLLLTQSQTLDPDVQRQLRGLITTIEGEIKARNISNISNTLLDRVTEHFTKEIDHYIDKYVDSLMGNKVPIKAGNARRMLEAAGTPVSEVESILDKYFVKGASGVYTGEVKVPLAAFFVPNASPEELLQVRGEDDLYKLIEHRGKATGQMDMLSMRDANGNTIVNMREKLKSVAAMSVREEVAREMKLFSNDPKGMAKLTSGITGSINHIASSITNKVFMNALGGKTGQVEKSLFSLLRHNWGGLGVTPTADVKRSLTNNLRNFMSKMTGGSSPSVTSEEVEVAKFHSSVSVERVRRRRLSRTSLPDDLAELEARRAAGDISALEIARKTEEINLKKAPLTTKISRGAQAFWDVGTSVFDLLEAIDLFSSFSRLSSANRSNMTRAQKQIVAREAGSTVNAFMQGIAVMYAVQAANTLVQGAAGAVGWKVVAPLLLVAGIVSIAAGINYMKDPSNRRGWSSFWDGINEFWGGAIFDFTEKAERWGGGGKKTSAIIMGAGGGAAGFSLSAAALGLFGAASAMAAGQFILAGIAIGVGIGAFAGYVAPDSTSNVFDSLVRSLSEVKIGGFPVFGMFLTRPGSGFHLIGAEEPSLGTSRTTPFMVGTVEQVIEADYRRYLLAAKDITGGDAAGLFISSTVYGSVPTRGNDVVSRYGKVLRIRPGGVVDPMLRRELQIRGQHFNQSIVGRQMWIAMLSNATNYRAIKSADYRHSIRSAALEMARMKEDNSPEVESKNLKYKNKLRKSNPEIRGEVVAQYVEDASKSIERAEKSKEEPLLLSFNMEELDNTNVLSRDYIVNGTSRNRTKTDLPVVTSNARGNVIAKIPNPEGPINDTILVMPFSEYDNV